MSSHDAASVISNTSSSVPISRVKRQRQNNTRRIIIEKIESVTGRKFPASTTVNPLKDNLNGPTYFRWVFSKEYPAFPTGGLSKWTLESCEKLSRALRNGHLTVRAIAPEDADDAASSPAGWFEPACSTDGHATQPSKFIPTKQEDDIKIIENISQYITNQRKEIEYKDKEIKYKDNLIQNLTDFGKTFQTDQQHGEQSRARFSQLEEELASSQAEKRSLESEVDMLRRAQAAFDASVGVFGREQDSQDSEPPFAMPKHRLTSKLWTKSPERSSANRFSPPTFVQNEPRNVVHLGKRNDGLAPKDDQRSAIRVHVPSVSNFPLENDSVRKRAKHL